jgi:hypothetical protein
VKFLFLGVDECASITLLYSNQRFATINVSTNCAMNAPTILTGEKGVVQVFYTYLLICVNILKFSIFLFKIPNFSWCPNEFIVNNKERFEFPLPECAKTNFLNSVGLR